MTEQNKFLPSDFLGRLREIIPAEHLSAVTETFSQERPVYFRRHSPRTDAGSIRQACERAGLGVTPVSWYPEGFKLERGSLRQLQETALYKKGLIYIQGLASMLVPLVLGVCPGQRVLDLTAAPGSKTAQLTLILNGSGELTANDYHPRRFYKLKHNMELQGYPNVVLRRSRGEILCRGCPGYFDRILLDAPCSSEGRFSLLKPESLGYWKPRKVHEMAAKQRRLLPAAFAALKPGGTLVYSTCTFSPEENEGVIDWAMKKWGGSAVIETPELPITNIMEGLRGWDGKAYTSPTQLCRRILPDPEMAAFFICKIRKTGEWTRQGKRDKYEKEAPH